MQQYTKDGLVELAIAPGDKVQVTDLSHPQTGRVATVYHVNGNKVSCRDRQCDFDADASQIEKVHPQTELTGVNNHWERGGVRSDHEHKTNVDADRSMSEPGRL